jgi:hypothetical protein
MRDAIKEQYADEIKRLKAAAKAGKAAEVVTK